MALPKCCYVLTRVDLKAGKPATYCNKTITKYKMVKDDDDRPVREYDSWCPEHMVVIERYERLWTEFQGDRPDLFDEDDDYIGESGVFEAWMVSKGYK